VGLERGPLSLVSTTEELLGKKIGGSGLRRPRLRPTSGCRSVGIVHSQTHATEYSTYILGSFLRTLPHSTYATSVFCKATGGLTRPLLVLTPSEPRALGGGEVPRYSLHKVSGLLGERRSRYLNRNWGSRYTSALSRCQHLWYSRQCRYLHSSFSFQRDLE
jgi:hypothetical protein